MAARSAHQERYEQVCSYLNQQGRPDASDVSYKVTIPVDDCEYLFRLQPYKKRKLAVLQAVQVYRDGKERRFKLVTDNPPPSVLLEPSLFQRKKNTVRSNLGER